MINKNVTSKNENFRFAIHFVIEGKNFKMILFKILAATASLIAAGAKLFTYFQERGG